MRVFRRLTASAPVAVLIALVAACGGVSTLFSTNSAAFAASPPAHTGSLNVLLPSAEWPNIDPGNKPLAASNPELFNSIYGGLFNFGNAGKIIPAQATGYKFSKDGLTVDIFLRHGLTFSDGTPLRAANAAWSINRTLDPANGCSCDSTFKPVTSVTAPGPYTLQLKLSRPFTSIIEAFDNTAPNWIADEAALKKMGEAAYGVHPIGAGPFTVVSDTPSSKVEMKANPRYWNYAHYPLVQNITFTSVGSDQSAYSAVQSGQADVASIVTTVPLVKQIEDGHGPVKVYASQPTAYEFVSLNQKTAPFSNPLAREALYYATDPNELVTGLYKNLFSVVQSPTASGEDFYIPKVPGYPTYNLAKAKAIVKKLGGLSFDLATTTQTEYFQTEVTGLAQQWAKAGIKTKLVVNDIEQTLAQLKANNWQALDSNWGDPDPALALPFYFEGSGPYTGIHDATLDKMIDKAAGLSNHAARLKIYKQISARLAKNYDAPFLYQKPQFTLASDKVKGLSTTEGFGYFDKVSVAG